MSKHETIERNLMALTHSASFSKATEGWTVHRLVALSKTKWQACELCGTRCHDGAMIRHTAVRATIFVGGTCLETLRRRRFGRGFQFDREKTRTVKALRRRYEELVDPHNWLKWVVDNAPRRLADIALDLRIFGAATSRQNLARLIEFHDRVRVFPRDALIGNAAQLERYLRTNIPSHLTIFSARRLLARQGAAEVLATAAIERYKRRDVLTTIRQNEGMLAAWNTLGPEAQRAVVALARLSEDLSEVEATPLLSDEAMRAWPAVGPCPAFVWHARVGLGFIEDYDMHGVGRADVWLWNLGAYGDSMYLLEYWRGVQGCSAKMAQRLVALAFPVKPPRWLADR